MAFCWHSSFSPSASRDHLAVKPFTHNPLSHVQLLEDGKLACMYSDFMKHLISCIMPCGYRKCHSKVRCCSILSMVYNCGTQSSLISTVFLTPSTNRTKIYRIVQDKVVSAAGKLLIIKPQLSNSIKKNQSLSEWLVTVVHGREDRSMKMRRRRRIMPSNQKLLLQHCHYIHM